MDNLESIRQGIVDPMTALWTTVAAFVLNLVSAVVILVIGYMVARRVKLALSKLLERIGINALSQKSGFARLLVTTGVETDAAELIGIVGFWLILLVFMVSAAEALGLERVSSTINDFVLYLPKVIGAALVALIGMLVAKVVRSAVHGVCEGMQLSYARGLASAVYGLLVVVVASLAIGELHIETELLNLVVVLLLAVGAAVALSLGLGTRELSANIIAGVYARDLFNNGDSIEVGELKGKVVEVGTTKTVIKGQGSATHSVSNRELLERVVTRKAASTAAK